LMFLDVSKPGIVNFRKFSKPRIVNFRKSLKLGLGNDHQL